MTWPDHSGPANDGCTATSLAFSKYVNSLSAGIDWFMQLSTFAAGQPNSVDMVVKFYFKFRQLKNKSQPFSRENLKLCEVHCSIVVRPVKWTAKLEIVDWWFTRIHTLTAKIGMTCVTLTFDLLTWKWYTTLGPLMGCICDKYEYNNPWNHW